MNDKLKQAIGIFKDYRKGEFVGDDEFIEAIDTVVKELEKPLPNDTELMKILYDLRDRQIAVSDAYARITLSSKTTPNKTGLDDRKDNTSIEQPDNQKCLSSKKDMELPTDEQIEQYAIENILDDDIAEAFVEVKGWIDGATWMRDLIRDKSSRVEPTYTAEDMEEFSHWYHRKVSVIGESELHLFGARPFQDIIDYWEKERSKK